MSEEVAHVLLTVFIIVPLLFLLFFLLGAMKNAWHLLSALVSLPF